MAKAGHKADVRLAGSGHVQNGKILRNLQHGAELVESAAMTRKCPSGVFRRYPCGGFLVCSAKSHRGLERNARGARRISGATDRTAVDSCSGFPPLLTS